MKPVLSTWSQKRRNLVFAPLAFGAFFLLFLILGFSLQTVFVPLLVAVPAGIALAWILLGWPVVTNKDGSPLIDPKVKPYLFFLLAPLATLVLYNVLGVALTEAGVPPKLLALSSLGAAILVGCAASYFLVGFPHVIRGAKESYAKIPPERRPFLFFPVFAVTFLILYLALGVGTTQLLESFEDKVVLLLNVQVLLLLPFTLLVSAFVAYLLVGFPKPQKSIRESLPKVTGKRRPHAFSLTFLLGGIPLTTIVGALLTWASKKYGGAAELIPDALLLPLALVLGYSLSLGLAAAMWGTPTRWRQFDDYTPGLSPRARLGAAGGAGLAATLAITIGFGVAGIDIFWGLLVGTLVGLGLGLVIAGFHKRVASRRGQETLLPDLPDRAKTLVLLSTWLALALLLFSVLTYALPDLVAWNALLGIVLGLAVSFLLVEQALLQDWRDERRRLRDKKKAWAARRKEALARGSVDADEGATGEA